MNPDPGRALALQAYDSWSIDNWIDPDPDPAQVERNRGLLPPFAIPHKRLGPATGRYNCHGLVFASRRTNVDSPIHPVNIDELLTRDGYSRVDRPQTGDIVVYRYDNGEIEHTGIVSRVEQLGNERVVFVWSKWGALEECEHREKLCPYADCTTELWRLL